MMGTRAGTRLAPSKGVENVEIPDVTGYDSYTAAGMLEEKGFVVDYGYESNGNIDEGYVIRQSPTGTATKGSSVTIIVSNIPLMPLPIDDRAVA